MTQEESFWCEEIGTSIMGLTRDFILGFTGRNVTGLMTIRVLRQDCDAVYSQQFFILGILLHKMTKLDVRRRPTHWLKSVELSDEVPYAEQAVGTSYMDGRRLI